MTLTTPCEWAKPVESEFWEVFESLDEANLAIAIRLREPDSPDEDIKRFLDQFRIVRGWLQKILLDVLSPQTQDPADSGLLRPAEATSILGIPMYKVVRWELAGMLHAVRTAGGHRRYKESEVRALSEYMTAREDTLTQEEAAAAVGVDPTTISRWAKAGKLHPVPYLNNVRYSRAEVLAVPRIKPPPPDIKPADIAMMRDEEKLTWPEIMQRTGMSKTSVKSRYAKFKKLTDEDSQTAPAQKN
jgi:hypothetical protein